MKFRDLIQTSQWCIGFFFVFAIAAMLAYRGGNPFNSTVSYSLGRNFLSDLGLFQGYNYNYQIVSNLLWQGALASAAIGVVTFVAGVSVNKAARTTATLASASFLAIGLLPSDLFFWPHRIALLSAVVFLTLTFALLNETRVRLFQIGLAITVGYLLFLLLAPHPDVSLAARTQQVLIQKLFVLSSFAVIFAEGRRRLRV